MYSMSKRVRVDAKRSKAKSVTSGSAPRWTLFGQLPLLDGEDAAAYDELHARVYAAVKPVDVIDEMFIADVVALECEVLRWRRLKSSWIQEHGLKALEAFLRENLDYDLYSEHFEYRLAEILQNSLREDQAEHAQELARKCAQNESGAVDEVRESLANNVLLNFASIRKDARASKAAELKQEYARSERSAIALVQELLSGAGMRIDTFMANAVAEKLDDIERIDRLAAIAESRRNASLREIERRRAVLGQALRRSVQEVEDAEFKVIETTQTKEKGAA
jgi:hypothetical protein